MLAFKVARHCFFETYTVCLLCSNTLQAYPMKDYALVYRCMNTSLRLMLLSHDETTVMELSPLAVCAQIVMNQFGSPEISSRSFFCLVYTSKSFSHLHGRGK